MKKDRRLGGEEPEHGSEAVPSKAQVILKAGLTVATQGLLLASP